MSCPPDHYRTVNENSSNINQFFIVRGYGFVWNSSLWQLRGSNGYPVGSHHRSICPTGFGWNCMLLLLAFETTVSRRFAMKKFLLGFFAAIMLIAVGGSAYLALGLAPVATGSAPLPFEKSLTGIALKARLRKEAPASSPILASDAVYASGAVIYRNNCAVCHGLPGQDQTAIAKGEFPKPPQLFRGKGVTDDPVGVT